MFSGVKTRRDSILGIPPFQDHYIECNLEESEYGKRPFFFAFQDIGKGEEIFVQLRKVSATLSRFMSAYTGESNRILGISKHPENKSSRRALVGSGKVLGVEHPPR
jgi:hypothetical protein